MAPNGTIDLEHLMKLRLSVARHGELDLMGWWGTDRMLSRHGAIALRRSFPKTHQFARARVVFEVATARCHEAFAPRDAITLWSLPAWLEQRFEENWLEWVDQASDWAPIFGVIERHNDADLLPLLQQLNLISSEVAQEVTSLRRSAEGRAVRVSGSHVLSDDLVSLLAAAFARGEKGRVAVPYASLEE